MTLFASVPGTIVNLQFEVKFKRSSGFNQPIDFKVNMNLRPSAGNGLFVPGSYYGAKTSSFRQEALLGILCKRIEPPGGEPSVELEIFHAFAVAGVPASVRVRGTTSVNVSVNVTVDSAASDSSGRTGRVWQKAERPFVVTCIRDNPLM